MMFALLSKMSLKMQHHHIKTTPRKQPKMSNELFQHTIFINLEERKDRLEHAREELKKIGINNPTRFNAIKTTHGAVGCSLSHIKCLELAKERNYPHVFICEDDIEFLNTNTFMKSIHQFVNSPLMNDFDVLMIAGNNAQPFEKTTDFCVRVYNCRTTTGYVVKQHYYDVLINNYKEGVASLMREPENKERFAIDMFMRPLQQRDKWFLIYPLSVVQMESYSDVENRNVNYRHLMTDLEKKWLQNQCFETKNNRRMSFFIR